MQITSNYYRYRLQRYGFNSQLLTVPELVTLSAPSECSSNAHGKPLSPSQRTLRDLAALNKSENKPD